MQSGTITKAAIAGTAALTLLLAAGCSSSKSTPKAASGGTGGSSGEWGFFDEQERQDLYDLAEGGVNPRIFRTQTVDPSFRTLRCSCA